MDPVEQVIANLREWRALPGYSVERRLDVLLTPFLESFLSSEMGGEVQLVTAEFPLPRTLFRPLLLGKAPQARHVSADFLCLRRGAVPAWILVELKTDAGSRRAVQDDAYVAIAASHSMGSVLAELARTKAGSEHRDEYEAVARRVRRAARGAGDVEKMEICYVEPLAGMVPDRELWDFDPVEGKVTFRTVDRRADTRNPRDGREGVVVRRLGLGKLASHIPREDPFGRMLQRVLRGIARSEKGRRPRGRRRVA